VDPLAEEFNKLSREEKLEFVKQAVMPTMFEMFAENPQQMMQELKPRCKELMADKDMEMPQMMKMMGMEKPEMMEQMMKEKGIN